MKEKEPVMATRTSTGRLTHEESDFSAKDNLAPFLEVVSMECKAISSLATPFESQEMLANQDSTGKT